jgi:GNAT superfamily N-acetyltransferase
MIFQNEFGEYQLDPMPGCGTIAISHGIFVRPNLRGRGLGKAQHVERLQKARDMNYECLLATVNATNAPQIHIMEQQGWKRLESFHSVKCESYIGIWMKLL